MTGVWDVDALAESMPTSLLFEWSEHFRLKAEAEKAAYKKARRKG